MRRMCVCALSAFVISWLPLLVAWVVLGMVVDSRRSSMASASPNPDPAPWYFLGPADLLVYLEPRLAGAIHIWWWLGISIIVVFSLMSAYVLAPHGQRLPLNGRRRVRMLLWISIVVGIVFAGPWMYALLVKLTAAKPQLGKTADQSAENVALKARHY